MKRGKTFAIFNCDGKIPENVEEFEKYVNENDTEMDDDYDDAKFLLWSPSAHLLSEDVGGNCFVFKTCDEKRRISIINPGITYQLKRINTIRKGVYLPNY